MLPMQFEARQLTWFHAVGLGPVVGEAIYLDKSFLCLVAAFDKL